MKTILETKKVLLHELFTSRQGEGLWVGEKQIFLRFSKCNMACVYCDTNNEVGTWVSIEELAARLEKLRWSEQVFHSVSLTGGEPLLHVETIPAIAEVVHATQLKVFLETNATLPKAMAQVRGCVDMVSLDLKLPSVGKTRPYWQEHVAFLKECRGLERYVKIVLSEEVLLEEFQQAIDLIAEEDPCLPTVLQLVTPCGQVQAISHEKLKTFQERALAFLWDVRIQPQWHKLWHIP